ncbi:ribonuclease 3 [Sitophilus oryzae]|uniref:Ribonuclease 3 n=1 Tax=Sitophilus oryzae TaxID=7048 RepID=A0A6J2XCC2_SITOR|nr:ribonuclease 3 [Sitophilus oryzae]
MDNHWNYNQQYSQVPVQESQPNQFNQMPVQGMQTEYFYTNHWNQNWGTGAIPNYTSIPPPYSPVGVNPYSIPPPNIPPPTTSYFPCINNPSICHVNSNKDVEEYRVKRETYSYENCNSLSYSRSITTRSVNNSYSERPNARIEDITIFNENRPTNANLNNITSQENIYKSQDPAVRIRVQDSQTRAQETKTRDQDRRYRESRTKDRESTRDRESRIRSRSRSRSRYRSRSRHRSSSKYRDDSRERNNYRRYRTVYKEDRSTKHYSDRYNTSRPQDKKILTERDEILDQWKRNYCNTEQQISEKLEMYNKKTEDILNTEKNIWIRSTPSELYYERDINDYKNIRATSKLINLCDTFKDTLVNRALKVNSLKPKYTPPPRKNRARLCKHKTEVSSSDSDSSEIDLTDEEDYSIEELQIKQRHPDRLHQEMWYNDSGEMNDGPLCRCSHKSKKSGIRHGIYPGETPIMKCDINSNNSEKLYHYRIIISPPTNFLIKAPTIIQYDEHEFIFEGFSIFSHSPLVKLPPCKVIRFNIEYTILYYEEKIPDNFTVCELDLFTDFLFKEILELVDLDLTTPLDNKYCSQYHFMPRFVREIPDNGKEILCMQEVLQYLLKSSVPLIDQSELGSMVNMSQYEWQNFADELKGMVVTYPGKKPSSVRVDQLDRNIELQKEGDYKFPEIVHFGIRPPQLSYAGNPDYQKAWREYVKFRHLIANMSKPTFEDKRKLEAKENKLQEMRTQGKMKRDVTVAVSAEGFYRTGIMCDIVQHAMLIPVLVCHLRFHYALNILEQSVDYKFKNRGLLQLALTHPSYRENFGTNPDHARNSLTNCGIRQPEYGDRRIHYMNTRKRGINTLINIMSRFGKQRVTESNIRHNERLEFLGDAVVEFLSSIHLFFSFPHLEEGGLATYRAAIVQNQHLALLAKVLKLDQFMLYAHGSDLCHDLELEHAMANCFEALMGALFLDGGIDVADRVFSNTLYKNDPELLQVWVNLPPHPLQEQEPLGDRHWIEKFDILKKLTGFEKSINIEFNHIRLLARAFTDRSVGYTNLTMGSNQRLEFLGDTVLQLIASEYLYKYFPEHHEGHLSLLRSSLVNNRTQAVVCDDLGMAQYALYNNPKPELKTKDRADLLEAFIGALYVDQGMEYCEVFCQVTLFPRLQDFIMNQDWNDPKSKLQQCCLTLRTMEGGEPDIPVYKVIECKGPTNTRVYTVAVYFRGKRLASAMGHSIQQAEMNAAKKALEISQDLFPQLDHQKRVIAKSMKRQKRNKTKAFSNFRRLDNKSPESYSRKRFRSRSPSDSKYKQSSSRKDSGSDEEKYRPSSSRKYTGSDEERYKPYSSRKYYSSDEEIRKPSTKREDTDSDEEKYKQSSSRKDSGSDEEMRRPSASRKYTGSNEEKDTPSSSRRESGSDEDSN